MENLRFVDLFCGLGGLRLALENVARERAVYTSCVLSSDIDPDAQASYQANFGEIPLGDICSVDAADVPQHDVLLAGFPCQPFSIIGERKGFEDTRGTLFFEIARLLANKRPKVVVLENVKQLVGHDQGRTFRHIINTLTELGYFVHYKVLNALHYGLPQKRERVFIVAFSEPVHFVWPDLRLPMQPLESLLEAEVADFYYASPQIQQNRLAKRDKVSTHRTIWHENKGGHISAYPYSCALRAGASYNYLLVDGERRLTEREMLRLQGFPDTYNIVAGYSAMRKLTGNTVAIPVVEAVLQAVLEVLQSPQRPITQLALFSEFALNQPLELAV